MLQQYAYNNYEKFSNVVKVILFESVTRVTVFVYVYVHEMREIKCQFHFVVCLRL